VLIEHPDACPDPVPAGAQPLVAGRFTASVVEQGGRLVGGLTIDGVAVRFDTSLDRASLARVLASLAVSTTTTPSSTGDTTTTTR
jgi:hypothetical protein